MGSGGIYFLMTQRVADIPTVNTHPPPSLPPSLFVSLRAVSSSCFRSSLVVFLLPHRFTAGLGGGRTERD